MKSIAKKIQTRIFEIDAGIPFIAADFLDIAPSDAVRVVLSRLEQQGAIRRLIRGIYVVPQYSDMLQREVGVTPHRVVEALARLNGWSVIPSGENALNSLGLSTQVPARYVYISSGPYKHYNYEGIDIELNHRASRNFLNRKYKSQLAIQALKALGRGRVTSKTMEVLTEVFNVSEIEDFYNDALTAESWIFEVARALRQAALTSALSHSPQNKNSVNTEVLTES